MLTPHRRSTLSTRLASLHGSVCCWCNQTCNTFTLEHILPRSRGGANSIENLRLACRACNMARRDALSVELIRRVMPLPQVETVEQLLQACPTIVGCTVRPPATCLHELEGILCAGVEYGGLEDAVIRYIPVGVCSDVCTLELAYFEWLRKTRGIRMSAFADTIASAILKCESLFYRRGDANEVASI